MHQAITRKRMRHPSPVRRQLIVEAAASVIADKGLAATSARDVAASAGIAVGTLTYHFSSVDEILMEVIRTGSAAFDERRVALMPTRARALKRLEVYLGAYFDEEIHPRALWRIWFDFWARATHDPSLRSWQIARYHEVYGVIAALLEAGVDNGEFAPTDTEECARELIALIDGLGEQMTIDEALTPARARSLMKSAIRRRLCLS